MAEPRRKTMARPTTPEAPALEAPSPLDLDRVIHERVRLGIVSALAGHEALSFNELKETLGLTDGNLSAHARKLEEAGYVRCRKSFVDRVPRTMYALTGEGRAALERYLHHLEALIERARGAEGGGEES